MIDTTVTPEEENTDEDVKQELRRIVAAADRDENLKREVRGQK